MKDLLIKIHIHFGEILVEKICFPELTRCFFWLRFIKLISAVLTTSDSSEALMKEADVD